MSTSYTFSDTISFTLTHAKYLASKVATDLKRMQRFYGSPSDVSIGEYEAELTELLKAGYLGTVTYGFRKGENWVEPALRYTARDLAGLAANDDDPGKVRPGIDVTGASFYSYLTYSTDWSRLTTAQQDAFKRTLPFQRTGANELGLNGYMVSDLTYSTGGRALNRFTLRGY
jgi:hypothetical protein